ncbi:hypothetical protein C5612_18850 [Pseudomonas frederiksbergensis]|uniref:Uncharacterized protein n=1 Tax=Pseudomonas frederiksbergensis TaxID=104087 RepID=A0A2S8HJJ1_9PSED|nr:hypothetical protein C5612_18850 [Pseudomonas frederiksbergensis]
MSTCGSGVISGGDVVFSGPLREQARSHIGSSVNTDFVHNRDPMWERACSRRGPDRHPFLETQPPRPYVGQAS